jgi:hypothetical protein
LYYGSGVVVAGSGVVEVEMVSESSEGVAAVLVVSVALVVLLTVTSVLTVVVTSGLSEGCAVDELDVSISASPLVVLVLDSSEGTVVVVGGRSVALLASLESVAPSSPEY